MPHSICQLSVQLERAGRGRRLQGEVDAGKAGDLGTFPT